MQAYATETRILTSVNESFNLENLQVTLYDKDDGYVHICSWVSLFEISFASREIASNWLYSDNYFDLMSQGLF